MPGKWKCTVCGYLHEGPEPLPRCPRCGTDGTRFIPLSRAKFNLIRDLRASFIPHAVASHFPSGLVPAAFLFLILAWVTGERSFAGTVFQLLVIVWLAIPVLIVSGIYDWRKRYGGIKAAIFYKKIALATALFVTDSLVLAIRFSHPDILVRESGLRCFSLALIPVMMVFTALLGHYGGKLAFQWKKRKG